MKTTQSIVINGHTFNFYASNTEGTRVWGSDGIDLVHLDWAATERQVEAALMGWVSGFWKGTAHGTTALQAYALKIERKGLTSGLSW